MLNSNFGLFEFGKYLNFFSVISYVSLFIFFQLSDQHACAAACFAAQTPAADPATLPLFLSPPCGTHLSSLSFSNSDRAQPSRAFAPGPPTRGPPPIKCAAITVRLFPIASRTIAALPYPQSTAAAAVESTGAEHRRRASPRRAAPVLPVFVSIRPPEYIRLVKLDAPPPPAEFQHLQTIPASSEHTLEALSLSS